MEATNNIHFNCLYSIGDNKILVSLIYKKIIFGWKMFDVYLPIAYSVILMNSKLIV